MHRILTASAAMPFYAEERSCEMYALLAYFDPGSGSLLLQMLVGGSAGLFVFARYLWEQVLLRNGPSILRGRK